jgi:hypothetical protein
VSRRGLACIAVGLSILGAPAALGDTAPVPATAPPPGSDPSHSTPLEQLASRIAAHIAGRSVTVHCDGDAEWANVVLQAGGDPSAESGFVATQWLSTGKLLSQSTTAELSLGICQPLAQFAQATTKPTKCLVKTARLLASTRRAGPAIVPCYLGGGKTAARMTPAFWASYNLTSVAIFTLAHESIHLGGIVGGLLSNGLIVGDPQAETKADCFGMQWMPYVAEQLGDTPDDAQSIARWFWDKVYPLSRSTHPEYWSADCRPGGTFDERPPGVAAWP